MEYVKVMSRLNDLDRIRLEVDASVVSKYMVCDL